MKVFARPIALLLTCFASSAFPCQFDTDCVPGSICLTAGESNYGVCAGGAFPGNSHDRQPVSAALREHKTYGNTCALNGECGPGYACFKSTGSNRGLCMDLKPTELVGEF